MPKAPDPDDVYAGSKLRLQRRMRSMSQTELAKSLGVTFQQVQKYEKGSNRISASRLQMVSGILGVPISFFFRDTDLEPKLAEDGEIQRDSLARFISTADGLKLNRAFLAISDQKIRRSVVALVKVLAEAEAAFDGDKPENSSDHSPIMDQSQR
jgi:transcriptional regulator with XRE-family HTH domain